MDLDTTKLAPTLCTNTIQGVKQGTQMAPFARTVGAPIQWNFPNIWFCSSKLKTAVKIQYSPKSSDGTLLFLFSDFKLNKQKKQECIPVGCVPFVAVTVGGDVCPGGACLGSVCLGWCLPRGEVSAPGVSAWMGCLSPPVPSTCWDTHPLPSACWDTHPTSACWDTHPPPRVDRILDTLLWKHYLSATTVADGINL